MDPKAKKQKLSTTEIASPSLSKMELEKKKKKKKAKKQKVDVVKAMNKENDVAKVTVVKAMKKQNDHAMFFAEIVISAVATNSNFVFSPASINAVLTMVAATTEHETLKSLIFSFLSSSSIDELKAVFREVATVVLVDGSESGGPKISSINGVWMEQSLPFNPSSKDLLENFFKAAFSLVDFPSKSEEVREEVNSWASRNTNELIKEILQPGSVTRDTICIYGNALYFKGAWEHKFDKSLTKDKKFHLLNGTTVSVPFMSSRSKQYVKDYDNFKVLKLPFRQSDDINRQFSMYFYLPNAKDGLYNLVKRMASTPRFLDSHIPSQKVQVGQFRIPKFKIEFGFEASEAFKELNLGEVKLYHKALVEIDEDGAEAAAVSVCMTTGGPGPCHRTKINFVADHPFLFLIREDKTGTILFVGQIFDPSKSASA